MPVSMISIDGTTVTVEVKVELSRSMLNTEEAILASLNEAGCQLTQAALKYFDTDGSAIMVGETKLTSKGEVAKVYQTPYGEVEVSRHVYQTVQGGKTFCPLERDGRLVITATPRLAKMVSSKFAQGSSTQVARDLAENHGRPLARSYLKTLSEAVGSVVQAKEENWCYHVPSLAVPITTVAVGLDGTCMLLCEQGYREAMTGTLSLYDADGTRQHTIYIGATPEYGKAQFLARMEREINHLKTHYSDARYVGLADGAADNWRFLEHHTSVQILDFYHASGYLADVATAVHPRSKAKRSAWLNTACHQLKHESGSAEQLLAEMQSLAQKTSLAPATQDKLASAMTYYDNHHHQMDYARFQAQHLPIGSGVTEAACKTLVKQRLCGSGMKWKETGAATVLSLRALVLTTARWEQFWAKVNQYGFPVAA
ncbi:MAG: ISKra4 family transposase [Shimia sp.]|nr:ISKra4 family transposase [Shimia sp.]MCP4356890.1 ISKra4 family transposase [Chloroflexota bacterium]